MESLDLNTRLPPRKRLLAAGLLNKESSYSLPNIPSFYSESLYSRIHKAVDMNTSSNIEEIVEMVNSVAIDAAEAAKSARNNAVEKWIVAKKAKAAATSALEMLDLVNGSVEDDEKIARKLHRDMNSSPRIMRKPDKRIGRCRKNGDEFTEEKHRLGSKFACGKKMKVNKRKKMLLSQFNTVKSIDGADAKLEAIRR